MRVAIFAFDGITMFHLAAPQMVFDEVRRLGLGDWQAELFTTEAGPVRTAEGLRIDGVHGLEAARRADLVVVPSWFDDGRPADPALTDLLHEAHGAGVPIAGLCLGAIAVADAGLLAGRRAVTHWKLFEAMATRHPDVELDETVLYIDHGDVLTSAGTASAIDACLHIVREHLGADAANQVARDLVIAPHRDGGQAQYIERPVPEATTDQGLHELLGWALASLEQPLTVDTLAARAHMSRRTFLRAFHAATGTTPALWVRSRRLDEARRLLETTERSIDQIAADCGFGSTVTFRQRFVAAFSTTPSNYRRRFGPNVAAAVLSRGTRVTADIEDP